MTANRDAGSGRRAAARRQGRIRRSTTPTRRRSSMHKTEPARRTPVFLDGEERSQKMTVGKGLKVNLFASEKEFPELVNPVQMAFDTKGRLWVAVWPTYPHWKPKEPMNDKLLILEDTNGDGKADKCTVFADELHNPTGFEFYNGGVLVAPAAGPDVPEGHRRRRQGRRPGAHPARPRLGRHAPRGQQLHVRSGRRALLPGRHVPPHAGRDAVRPAACATPTAASSATSRGRRSSTCTSRWLRQPARPRLRPLGPGHRRRRHRRPAVPRRRRSRRRRTYPAKAPRTPPQPGKRTRPCRGMEILSSRHFPDECRATCSSPNVHRLPGHPAATRSGGRRRASRSPKLEPILSSTDPNFRPSDCEDRPGRRALLHRLAQPDHRPHAAQPPRPQPRPRARPRLPRHLAGRPLLKPAKIAGEPIRSCSTCSRSPRTASAIAPGSS